MHSPRLPAILNHGLRLENYNRCESLSFDLALDLEKIVIKVEMSLPVAMLSLQV